MASSFLLRLQSVSRGLIRHARAHPWAVAALLLMGFLLSFFAELVDEVLDGDSQALDESILLRLRNPLDPSDPLGPTWLEEMMRDFTGLGGIAILTFLTITVALYLLIVRRRGAALYLVAAVGTGTILTNLLKAGFDRPRPDLVPHDVVVYTASFPSGHSMMTALVYLTLGALLAESQTNIRLRFYILAICVIITFMVGISRLYLGVHWPSDVLAGWIGGTFWALLCWVGMHYLRLHRAGRERREA